MLGSEILEIAIGVVFTFLLLSLTASTVRETFEGVLKTRAIQLERGLREMLDDPTGVGITKQLFDHPLLFGLFSGQYDPGKLTKFFISRGTFVKVVNGTDETVTKKRVRFHSNLPAYIPSRNFAMALLDLASKKNGSAALSLDAVRQTAVTLQNERLRRALLVAIGEAEGDIDRARTSLEAWFDGTMDRVSGWYTRAWIVKRSERTRQLIELGGLVAKAGLIELTDDDRAVLYGAMLEVAATLQGERRDQALTLWRRRGKGAFEDEAPTRE